MVDTPIPDFAEAVGRIQNVTGCRTQSELAKFLGIRQSSISDAKKRGSIPSDWLLTMWRKKGLNPDWILNGTGAKFVAVSEGITEIVNPPKRQLDSYSTQDLLIELLKRSAN